VEQSARQAGCDRLKPGEVVASLSVWESVVCRPKKIIFLVCVFANLFVGFFFCVLDFFVK
jgi:hypothetical protein